MIKQNFLFQLRDLQFSYSLEGTFNYSEKAFHSMPNFERFDKNNRYEMVLLVNALQRIWNLDGIEDCEKIEYLIRMYMPETINTQLEAADWLVLNWNTFSMQELAKAV